MAERPIGVQDLAAGAGVARYRTRERTVGAEAVVEQYFLTARDWITSWRGAASTFHVLGTTAATIPIATLWNGAGSGVIVAVRECTVAQELNTGTGTTRTLAGSRLTVAPTGGTLHTPTGFDTGQTHAALVEFRGSASSDAVNALITAPPAAQQAWREIQVKAPSVVGQFRMPPANGVPGLAKSDPVYLREGEGLVVAWIEAGSSTIRYVVNMVWDEVTF